MQVANSVNLRAPNDQGVTFVELFFDLVFVFAVTNVTGLVLDNLTLAGATQAILVFWMIWWAWTQFTWSLNPADTNHSYVRVATLIATGIAFTMATSVGNAYQGSNGLWFVVPYVLVRSIGLGLYLKISADNAEQNAAVRQFTWLSVAGLVLALLGGFVEMPFRLWLWALAVIVDIGAAGWAGNRSGWGISVGHFTERHGLIIIIVLGESLIATGVAALKPEHSFELFLVTFGAVVVTCLLWWLYFGWFKDGLEHHLASTPDSMQGRLGRDSYTFLHFPMLCGVIAIAAGMEEMVAHPYDYLHTESQAFFVGGVFLFVFATVLSWLRAARRLLIPRTLLIAAFAIGAFLAGVDTPRWLMLLCAGVLFAIILAERNGAPESAAAGA